MPSFISKVKKKLKSGAWYPFYNTFYEKVPVDKKEILLVSRSGLALENIKDFIKSWLFRKTKKSRFRKNWNGTGSQ